jgi:hypothetical protein
VPRGNEIAAATGHPEASVERPRSALHDLRKLRFGAYAVERRRRSPGTFEYRVGASPSGEENDGRSAADAVVGPAVEAV